MIFAFVATHDDFSISNPAEMNFLSRQQRQQQRKKKRQRQITINHLRFYGTLLNVAAYAR